MTFRIVDPFGIEMESGIPTREEAEKRLEAIAEWALGVPDPDPDPIYEEMESKASLFRDDVFRIEEETPTPEKMKNMLVVVGRGKFYVEEVDGHDGNLKSFNLYDAEGELVGEFHEFNEVIKIVTEG